jgi:hypothetical protein
MKTKKKSAAGAKRGFGRFDWQKSRKDAIQAIKVLRKVVKDAGADLSVNERFPPLLNYELGALEDTLNEMLPPDGVQKPDLLRGLFEDEDSGPEQAATPGTEAASNEDRPADTDQCD